MIILVGRKALYQHFHIYKNRKPTDIDKWGDIPNKYGKGVDYCQMPSDIMSLFRLESQCSGVACVEDLLAIKLSHLSYDIQWWKHAQDVLFLKYKQDVSPNIALYEVLKDYWKEKFGNKEYLSFYKTKDEFFDSFVERKYEHDLLHTLVAEGNAFGGFPVYELCLQEGQKVLVDHEKFLLLSQQQKLRMFKEEIAVIALERWIIPSEGRIPICHAWNKALHKTVTRLTKGWASEFIIMNLDKFTTPIYDEIKTVAQTLKFKGNELC